MKEAQMELSLSDGVAGSVSGKTTLPMLRPLQFGVIGYGYWGPQLVRNLSSLAGSSVEFIADLKNDELARAHTYHQHTRLTQRAADLFESNIDAIIIATPVHTHYALARQALLAGKHVFVEKPLAVKVSEVEELIHLAQEGNRILMVGYTFLYHAAVQELRRILVEGQLGKLHYIDTQRLNLGLFHQDINVIWDLAPHDLSMLHYLLDADPVAVRATGAAYIQRSIHDVAYIHLRYSDGMIAHMQLSWLHPSKVRRLTLVGDQRMAVYDDVEPHDKVRIYNRGIDRLPHSTTFEEFELSYRTGEIVIPTIGWKEPLQEECKHFAECIRTGKQPLSDGVWSLPITRTLETIQRSLELDGQEVTL
jgi:predicted dehydrogenase